ncbi:MAG: M28 family peptidase [Spirochaetales bacterium]|nr:M28 family peptidase [Spirochaetales bacterium]
MSIVLKAIAVLLAAVLLISCSGSFLLSDLDATEQALIQSAVDDVSSTLLYTTLETIDGSRTTRADCESAALALLSAAVSPKPGSSAAIIPVDGNDNIIAELPGNEPALPPVIVTAHWDWVYAPAMEDNASGMAGVIETARILATRSCRRTIRFILFDHEEWGMVGSEAYVSGLSAADLPDYFVNYDMISYTSSSPDTLCPIARQTAGDYIVALTPEWAAESVAEFTRDARLFVPDLRFYAATLPSDYSSSPLINNATRSDNESFWNRRAHGLFFTTADRDPYYHSPQDTIDTLDIAFLTKVVKAGLATICVRAGIQ